MERKLTVRPARGEEQSMKPALAFAVHPVRSRAVRTRVDLLSGQLVLRKEKRNIQGR